MTLRSSGILALISAFLLALPVPARAAQGCTFVLGFKTLHDLAPADVGDCVANQTYAANGDAVQRTTGGLLVWRKADNFTAFTNGYWTWINGPSGLARRLNSQRFAWEANPEGLPLATVPGQGLPPISVRQPQPYDLVDNPLLVAGIGTGFEAVIVVRVLDAQGNELARQSIHAGGTGILGNFSASLPLARRPATPQGTLQVFQSSPKDGSAQNVVAVPIIFGPALIDPYHGFAQYTVRAGDTLRSVARRWYGDASQWSRLLEANRPAVTDPDQLTPGQVLRIPQ